MFEESVKKYAEKGEFVEVYTNYDQTSRFDVGKIIACDSDYFIMSRIAPDIYFDGFMLERMDRILKINSETNYIKKTMRLLPHFNVELEKIGCIPGDLVASLLSYAKDNNWLVGIELAKSDLVDAQGFVKNVTQTMCEVESVNDYGECDGCVDVALEDITEIFCCTRKKRIVECLYHMNHEDSRGFVDKQYGLNEFVQS